MAGSYNRGYVKDVRYAVGAWMRGSGDVKCTTGDGIDALTTFVPVAAESKFLSLSMWQFLRDINEDGTSIILTTHYLEEAESLCRNIAIINHGVIVEHNAMKDLLGRLHLETFVLSLRDELERVPELPGYAVRRMDSHTLEVDVERQQGINGVFERLSERGIAVLSLRNKTNRLEELFLRLVEGGR